MHRRLICCVLAIEIAEHDQRPLFDQIRVTEDLRRVLAEATAAVPSQDLIPIAREDGALLAFVADAAACFAAALAVRAACLTQQRYRDMQPRIGIDLGPVEVLEDELGQAFLAGDGRRDAERLMRQVPPCQVSVSRSFFELLARVAPDLAAPLKYQGLLTDTVGRPLGWYALDPGLGLPPSSDSGRRGDAQARPVRAAPGAAPAGRAPRKLALSLRQMLAPLLALGATLVPLRELHAPAPAGRPADATAGLEAVSGPLPKGPSSVTSTEDTITASTQAVAFPARAAASPGGAAAKRHPAPRHHRTTPGSAQPKSPPAAAAGPGAAAAVPDARASASAASHPVRDPGSDASVSVRLAVRPWGEVTVDGRRAGITPPLKVLHLRPGKHLIAISNGTLPVFRKQLAVQPGLAPVTLAHDFGCVAVRDLQCPEANGTPVLASRHYHPKTTSHRAAAPLLIFGRAGGRDVSGVPAVGTGAAADAVAAR